MKKKLFFLCFIIFLLLLPELVSCNKTSGNKEDDIIEIGFEIPKYCEVSPWLQSGVRTKAKQKDEITLEIFSGYHPGFSERVLNGAFGVVSDNSTYFIKIYMRDSNDNDIKVYDDELLDFLDETKYSISICDSRRIYKYSYNKILNFSDFDIGKGYLFIVIDLIDNNTLESIPLHCGEGCIVLFYNKQVDYISFSSQEFK
jgi:hypothetical protein